MAGRKTAKKDPVQDRIEALQRMISTKCEDPACKMADSCKHEGEKDSARRTLARFMAKMKDQVTAMKPEEDVKAEQVVADVVNAYGWASPDVVFGPKYGAMKGADIKDKAAQIKRDILTARKVARPRKGGPLLVMSSRALAVPFCDPIGDAPEGVRFSVTSEYMGNGYSVIDITVKDIPAEWGWRWGSRRPGAESWLPTDALKALSAELERLRWAYNAYRGDQVFDLMTDMDNSEYKGQVLMTSPDGGVFSVDCLRSAEDVYGSLQDAPEALPA